MRIKTEIDEINVKEKGQKKKKKGRKNNLNCEPKNNMNGTKGQWKDRFMHAWSKI